MLQEKHEELLSMLEGKNYIAFMRELNNTNPIDTADFLNSLPTEKQLYVFRMLKKDIAADIFAELDTEIQKNIVSEATEVEIASLIEDLYVDDAVDMLEEFPAGMVKKILMYAKPETRSTINKFLSYPDNSAGSIMTAELIDLRKGMTVSEAIEHIRKTGTEKETVYVAYVTNKSRVLEGTIRLEQLLFASSDAKIETVMNTNFVCASTHDDRTNVASLISKYDLLALPIVDKEGRLVGIVTVDDAMDVIEEEATEDIEIMAAITPTDKPYLKTGVWETWKKRIPWLLLLMISATFTGQIISSFESALSGFPMLIAFIPMLMGTGGNSGGQSSVTIIRGLALGEIHMHDIFRIIWKEAKIALLCGIALAICNFVKIFLVDNLIFHNEITVTAALIVSLTLIVTVLTSKIVGCTLPIITKRLGLDPAVMASPFITTIVDAISLMIYFGFANMFLL